jgi:hypothetical protein
VGRIQSERFELEKPLCTRVDRPKSGEGTVQLAALPEGAYRLLSVMTGKALPPATHEAFARGAAVPFPGRVDVLDVHRTS